VKVVAASFIVDLLYHRVEHDIALGAHVASYDSRVARAGLHHREDQMV
jgi:hypothetical protein